MTQHLDAAQSTRQRLFHLPSLQSPGAGQVPGKMQGHWVLARAGKRVLRPGGIRLTRQMLEVLAIGTHDRVVEFAPGLGVTAGMVLQKHPLMYWGIEREPAAAKRLDERFAGTCAHIICGRAEDPLLPSASATVVFGEAILSMQNPRQKEQIVAEACRLLMPGGRFGIHELCLLPDDIPDRVRHEIQAAIAREIHVGVQPLSRKEWIDLLEQNGLTPIWSRQAPMHLLEPKRMLQDEGLLGSLRVAFRMATMPAVGARIRSMRRVFAEYGQYLGAISLVARREPPATQ